MSGPVFACRIEGALPNEPAQLISCIKASTMPSEGVQQQISRLLDEADEASPQNDWVPAKARA